jgi:hypothetical protein
MVSGLAPGRATWMVGNFRFRQWRDGQSREGDHTEQDQGKVSRIVATG